MSEEINKTFKEKILDLIVKYVPVPIIILCFFYALIMYGIYKVWFSLVESKSIIDEEKNKYLYVVLVIALVSTFAFVSILVAIFIINRKKKMGKESSIDLDKSVPKIETHIIEGSDNKARNDIYLNVNQGVKKSYKVYGTSLHSIASNHEEMLLKMAENKVNIQLCMMNPAITVDELCKNLIENDSCVVMGTIIKEGDLGKNMKEKISEAVKNYKDPLEESHIYISPCYIKDYFNTATDYKQRLKSSYKDLKAIVQKMRDKGNNKAEIKIMNSFIPISITIADSEEDSGKMVVEFYIPYTSNRVLIELNKKQHKNLFEGFLEFYNSLWDQSYE